jgi:hypothetical protein
LREYVGDMDRSAPQGVPIGPLASAQISNDAAPPRLESPAKARSRDGIARPSRTFAEMRESGVRGLWSIALMSAALIGSAQRSSDR